jgi:hypothetical protein
MSGIYKKKNCPNCGKEHRKRGIYCGISCANESRTITPETRKKMATSNAEYNRTPEGIASARRAALRQEANAAGLPPPVTIDDFFVEIPDLPPELPDGYDHASDW